MSDNSQTFKHDAQSSKPLFLGHVDGIWRVLGMEVKEEFERPGVPENVQQMRKDELHQALIDAVENAQNIYAQLRTAQAMLKAIRDDIDYVTRERDQLEEQVGRLKAMCQAQADVLLNDHDWEV